MKCLVVEHEPATAYALRKGLSEQGHVVESTQDGNEGMLLALELRYDVLIADARLPGRDGWSLVADLRAAGNRTPVLLLGAAASVSERAKALQLGADDCLAKPFQFTELLARIESIVRRVPDPQPRSLHIADLDIDPFRYHASRGGKRLNLTLKEFQILGLLARRPGEVFSRRIIADYIWGLDFTRENLLDVHVRRLRAKVDDPYETKLIHTVRGVGYVLEVR